MIARGEGLTKTYSRFHDPAEQSPDIVTLRDLHADMDRTVLCAYAASASTLEDAAAWNDLADRAEPLFLDEANEDDHTHQGHLFWPSTFRDEVLARLLALNAERAAVERAAGLCAGDERGGRRPRRGTGIRMKLLERRNSAARKRMNYRFLAAEIFRRPFLSKS